MWEAQVPLTGLVIQKHIHTHPVRTNDISGCVLSRVSLSWTWCYAFKQEKENRYKQDSRNYLLDLPIHFLCVSMWLHSSVLSHATRQVNANYYSGQEVCDRFQGVFLHLNATPALAPSCIGATCCTNSGQTLLTVLSNSVQAEKEQPFFPHPFVKRAIKYSVS